MALGKSMGGGVMPIGALLGTEASMDFDDVSTGSTWSWLPAACAAALATLDVFEREPVLENVMALEEAGLEGLRAMADRYRRSGTCARSAASWPSSSCGTRETKERDLELQGRVAAGCVRRGLLLDPSTTSLNIQPSLTMPVDVMGTVLRILDESIAEALGVIPPTRFDELAEGLNHPEGVAWNPIDGRVYAGGEGGEIYAVTLDGYVTLVGSSGGSMLGIAVDGNGVACTRATPGRARDRALGPGTGSGDSPTHEGSAAPTWTRPNVAAFGPDGYLYVTCSGRTATRRSARTSPSGGGVERWSDAVPGYPNGALVTPDGAALGRRGGPGAATRPRADRARRRRPARRSRSPTSPTPIPTAWRSRPTSRIWVTLYRPDGLAAGLAGRSGRAVRSTITSRRRSTRRRTSRGSAPSLDRVVVANVGDTFLSLGDVGVAGCPAPLPVDRLRIRAHPNRGLPPPRDPR